MSVIDDIANVFQADFPEPTNADFSAQMGLHLSNVLKMLDVSHFGANVKVCVMKKELQQLADWLTNGHARATIDNREVFLNSIIGQQVSAVGLAYCAKMQPTKAMAVLSETDGAVSSFSRFGYSSAVCARLNLKGLY